MHFSIQQQKNPDDRYATAQEFRRALANVSSRSFAIDSGDLATLLHAVMTKEIEEQNQVLPDNVTQIVAVGPDTNPNVVNQQLLSEDMTGQRSVAADDPGSFMMESEDYQVGPNTFPETTNGLRPMNEATASPPASVSGVQPVREGPQGPTEQTSAPTQEAPASIPGSLWFGLLVLVGAVAFGIPGAFRLGQTWTSSSPSTSPPAPITPAGSESMGAGSADASVPIIPVTPSADGSDASTETEAPPEVQEETAEAATTPDASIAPSLPEGQEPPVRPRRRRPPRRPNVPMMDTPF